MRSAWAPPIVLPPPFTGRCGRTAGDARRFERSRAGPESGHRRRRPRRSARSAGVRPGIATVVFAGLLAGRPVLSPGPSGRTSKPATKPVEALVGPWPSGVRTVIGRCCPAIRATARHPPVCTGARCGVQPPGRTTSPIRTAGHHARQAQTTRRLTSGLPTQASRLTTQASRLRPGVRLVMNGAQPGDGDMGVQLGRRQGECPSSSCTMRRSAHLQSR